MAALTIPLLPCKELAETLEFYRRLGFEVTHQQTDPYVYGAVRRHDVHLHFARLSVYGAKNAFGACLVLVDDVTVDHAAFADGLRSRQGRVPTAGFPRITRLNPTRTRFTVFDPAGNLLTFIDLDEPDAVYDQHEPARSPLAAALHNAVFLRDTYSNDPAAAKTLDAALERQQDADPLDLGRALAARAELAVALGETERLRDVRAELARLPLSPRDRVTLQPELEAADRLERWITGRPMEQRV
jgi:catechol 2,3-dioxygenase-like lactoylglutathione lyase family enzyme